MRWRGCLLFAVTLPFVWGCGSDEDHPSKFQTPTPNYGTPLEDALAGELLGNDCPVAAADDLTVQCGTLTVPLDHKAPDGTQISLALMVYRGQGPADAEPVVYLEGGPGGHALESVAYLTGETGTFSQLLEERDLVVFDQRGVGFSSPELDCEELHSTPGAAGDSEAEQRAATLAAVRSCHDSFVTQGFDPKHFNSRQNAADVDAVRAALGYSKWHLFGISYGTRLALDVMRHHPDGVASVVLDSTLPTQVDFSSLGPANAERAFEAIFDACAGDSACNTAYPGFKTDFYTVAADLDSSPYRIASAQTEFNGSDFINFLFSLAYSAEAVAYFPRIVDDFRSADFSLLDRMYEDVVAADSSVTAGMYLSVVCSEYVAFSSVAALTQNASGVRPELVEALGNAELFDICGAWSVPAAPAAERNAVVSDLPTLALAGNFDPVTPPSWTALAADTLSQSFYLEYPEQSHGASTGPCGGDLLLDFMAQPSADPSASCPAGEFEFFLPSSADSAATTKASAAVFGSARQAEPVADDAVERIRRALRSSPRRPRW